MRRVRRAFAISIAFAGGLFGCELLVSNSVPNFTCTAGDPLACPANMSCDPGTSTCVSGLVDGSFVDTGTTDGTAKDSGKTEAGSNLAPIGSKCASDDSCQSGLICGTTNILTTQIVDSTTNSICTQSCCTSADCPASFICYGAGTGGNYCVSATIAGRGKVGALSAGTSCTVGEDCRSGVCDDNHCLDVCCNATQCAAGTTCRVKSINTPATENWVCATPPDLSTLNAGDSCSSTTKTCIDDNCSGFPQKCRPSCCSSKECQNIGANLGICAYGEFFQTSAVAKWCFDAVDGGAGAPLGASCSGDGDCSSRFCDRDHGICADVCCQDTDCNSGQVCRPSKGSGSDLHCVNLTAQ